jgi:DNA-binding response OmpR family regulator
MHILVVEDDRPLARILRKSIESSGHTVDIVGDGDEALRVARARSHDALVLDLQLPRLSGIEVCRRLRDDGNPVPIIMLTARGTVADRIEGLDVGADDYLPKPFSLAELQARLRALHRRGKVDPELLRSGSLELDTTARELRVNGTSVELTGTELALLEYLMRNPGVVLSRDQLREQVWGDGFEPASNFVEFNLHSARRKLMRAAADQDPIRTVRGLGYSFRRAD